MVDRYLKFDELIISEKRKFSKLKNKVIFLIHFAINKTILFKIKQIKT